MFAQNERISTRQFKRLLTLELFGVTTVLLPGILCENVRRDGVTALAGGLILVLLFGWLLRSVARCSGRSVQQTLKDKGSFMYEIFLFVMLVQMILMGIWVLTLVAEMSRDILLQGTDIRLLILTFAAVSMLGAIKGMECRGRLAEILYLILLVPFAVLLVLAARKVNVDFLPPLMTEPAETVVSGCYEVFIVFQGVTLGFFALPYLKKQKTFWKGIKKSVLLNGLFCFALMGVSIGIFGLNGAARQKWLAVNLMTTPEFPGGLTERLDVLMVTIWIVSLFFFVSGSFFHGGKMIGRLFKMQHEKTGILVMTVLVALGAFFMGNREYAYYVYLNYMKYIGVPLMIVVLLLILWSLRPAKALKLTACFFMVWCLTGCAKGVELDDREFVLALGVDWTGEKVQFYYDTSDMNTGNGSGNSGQTAVKIETDGFYELQSAFGQQSDKYLDYNHLKVILIGKNLASNREKLEEFLRYIEKNELFARNTKLFFVEESLDGVFELCPDLKTALGEYLEKIYVDSNYYVEEQSASIGELINHSHDSYETMLVPVLTPKEKKLLIESYAVVRQTKWIEYLSAGDANLIFLANGVNIPMDLLAEKKYAVRLEQVNREVSFLENESGQPVAEVEVKVRGRIVSEEVTDERMKGSMENDLEKQLKQLYEKKIVDWKELDVFHLFRSLGSHDRQLWEKYHEKRQEFNQKVQVNLNFNISIV